MEGSDDEEKLSPKGEEGDREGRDAGDTEGCLQVADDMDEMEFDSDIKMESENSFKINNEPAGIFLEENDIIEDGVDLSPIKDETIGPGYIKDETIGPGYIKDETIGPEYFDNDIGTTDSIGDVPKNETSAMDSTENILEHSLPKSKVCIYGMEPKKVITSKPDKNMPMVPYKKGTLSTNSAITKPANLPDCKVRRSYVCGYCNMKTINPREYLYHLKDDHGEIIRIYECSYCVYASKTHQKLVRHTDMVHKIKLKPESEKKVKPTKPTKSPRSTFGAALSRSPRESKSPRRFEEYDFSDDFLDGEEYYIPSNDSGTGKQTYQCNQCECTVSSRKELGKHKAKYHFKKKFYKCHKCTYATNMKARYTKHLKYHELPIIKCDWCDFRTPYKWNLDRHIKNHTEDSGEHKCHLCNFSASIRQSLSAHVLNHHLTPEQIEARERRRTLGIYESEEDAVGDEELEMLRMEREEDLDALEVPSPSDSTTPDQSFTVSNIDMGSQDDNDSSVNDNDDRENGEPKRKKPKIKITIKKMKAGKNLSLSESGTERHILNNDFVHPDDVVHRNGNVYIKTEKCSLCSYKAPFQHEIVKHKKKVHGIYSLKETPGVKKLKKQKSFEKLEHFSGMLSAEKFNSISKLCDQDSFDEKLSDTSNGEEERIDDYSNEDDSSANQSPKKDNDDFKQDYDSSSRDNSLKKKSTTSFFDKLQEKLSLSNVQNLVCQFCGHESKCLSESVRHQKLHLSVKNIFATASLSTRCQFCRHRCKTTDDLMSHLKSCPEARKNQIGDETIKNAEDLNSQSERSSEGKSSIRANSMDSDEAKHPMENKVFVWNNMTNEDNESGQADNEMNFDDASRSASEFDNVDSDDQMNDYVNALKSATTKVYRCPQCSFRSTTASRFHVHMVGHYNKKPYSCSICPYRSNWRWDITKHIKLKIPRDENHKKADICLTDETLIEKNYEKYDKYVTEVTREEIHHSEGGFSMSRKGLPKNSPNETDSNGTDSAKSSPCPTPILNGSVATRIPAPPKLTRAPNRQSFMGQNQVSPVVVGVQAMSEKVSQKPPPLQAMGNLTQQQPSGTSVSDQPSVDMSTNSTDDKIEPNDEDPLSSSSNYQIITQQGAMNTSLETLQLLASGSTNLARLKKQQEKTGLGNDPELDAAVTNQMRLLLWLNCLVGGGGGTEQKDGDAPKAAALANVTNPPGGAPVGASNIMSLVLDHEGNPEWKCATCDFRDNEQDTVAQHVRLAHGKKGPVSLVHAVHRCSLCGFAAGTKRHVQVHIESDHGGRGGIISRSEGQNIDAAENNEETPQRSFECRLCPFNCKKRMELKSHLSHHTPRVDYIFKCMFCPFYVATKNELFAHLSVHGMDIPTTNKEPVSNGAEPIQTSLNAESNDDNSARQFVCDLCPFETRSRAKLMHHRQFHRPRNLPFSCPHCSYNVTRRHLLAQHLRIHGVSPTEGMDGDVATDKPLLTKIFMEDSRSARKSPSPSLTITPITSSANMTNGTSSTSNIDPDCLPNLSNELTKNLPDIPLVWVSRDGRFFKMFKCRHCPHVNLRKTNIQEHEKMHRSEGLVPGAGHSCQFCSYTCINAGVMSAHVKVHSGSMGKCHALVDPALANEEQLRMLAGSSINKSFSDKAVKKGDEKLLYYCQHCPARFFFEKEVHIHSRSHNVNAKFTHHCSKCDFGGREESQVLAHAKVHTPEYQERTRTLMSMHPSAPTFPPVARLSVPGDVPKPTFGVPLEDSDVNRNAKGPQLNGISRPWLISSQNNAHITNNSSPMPQPPPTSRFKCDQCPSTFSKLITLQYHQSLHSADNPFRCTRCSYAAKTQDGLQQHVALHEQADLEKNTSNSVMSSAASSPAPSPSPVNSPQKLLENAFGSFGGNKIKTSLDQPPIKLKFIGLKGTNNSTSKSAKKQQFKYYIEEQVPLSGVELLKRKHQIEREMPKDAYLTKKESNKSRTSRPEDRSGNPALHYPLHIDKSSGRSREKRYKCIKCPSAFEKLDQFNVHINLHGSNYKYRCRICNYSVKFYANFMMHIKRHKYHEKVDAQRKGRPGPGDDAMMFEPLIGENSVVEGRVCEREPDESMQDKENHFDFDGNPEMTTAEKQHLILQNKKADSFLPKDDDKDKRIFYCQFCPYANLRRDAVDSHSLRHQANSGKGVYQCKFCDYCASGPNFIREHTKVHFRPFKYVIPEGFMKHDKLEIWSIKSGEIEDTDDTPKKSLTFTHDDGIYGPKVEEVIGRKFKDEEVEKDEQTDLKHVETIDDPQDENGILVDFRSGDVLEAPNSFIIPLRPSKGSRSTTSNGATSKESSRSSRNSYSKSKRARKHAKMKSNQNLINVNDSSNDANIDFQESTVTVDENMDYNGHAFPSEACGEDPLDISNHSDSLVGHSNDETAVDEEMEESLEHADETIENGEETIENDGENIENGEESIENGVENVENGEEAVGNDDQDYEMTDCSYDNSDTKINSMECVSAV